MIPTLCAVILAAAPAPVPPEPGSLGAIYKAAAADLVSNVPPEKRMTTRYWSLQGLTQEERARFLESLTLYANGASIQGELFRLAPVGDLLVRLDLTRPGWDRFTRELELEKLQKLGVDLRFKRDLDREYFLDAWEFMAFFEPFFRDAPIDPVLREWIYKVSGTRNLVLSAHWVYPRLVTERQDGGFYSVLLILPPTHQDLEKRLGVDRKFADADPRAIQGAAVIQSAEVAWSNREVEFLNSATGYDHAWVSVTNDFDHTKIQKAKDAREAEEIASQQDVRERPAGTSTPDAHEWFFSLNNGLIATYLSNAAGIQQNIAPDEVALDHRPPPGPDAPYRSPTKTVVNAYKCMDCHRFSDGLIGFDDGFVKLAAPPRLDTAFVVQGKDERAAIKEAIRIEQFYRSGIREKMALYRASFAARVRSLTGQSVSDAYTQAIEFYDRFAVAYYSLPVTPEQAARELGLSMTTARVLWKASNEPQLLFLAAGQPISSRLRWEQVAPATFKPRIHLKKAG